MAANSGYITKGLVLWFDGLNRGGTPGQWVDRVGGNVCTLYGNVTELSDCVTFNPASENEQYGILSSTVLVDKDVGTVEFVLRLDNLSTIGRPVLTMYSGYMGGSFASKSGTSPYGPAMRWYCYGSSMYYYTFDGIDIESNNLIYTASAHSDFALCNGSSGTKSTVSGWPARSYPRIASRGEGNPFVGSIYAIRLYNRHLTQAEMLHNQRLDNKRYNLGLTI